MDQSNEKKQKKHGCKRQANGILGKEFRELDSTSRAIFLYKNFHTEKLCTVRGPYIFPYAELEGEKYIYIFTKCYLQCDDLIMTLESEKSPFLLVLKWYRMAHISEWKWILISYRTPRLLFLLWRLKETRPVQIELAIRGVNLYLQQQYCNLATSLYCPNGASGCQVWNQRKTLNL